METWILAVFLHYLFLVVGPLAHPYQKGMTVIEIRWCSKRGNATTAENLGAEQFLVKTGLKQCPRQWMEGSVHRWKAVGRWLNQRKKYFSLPTHLTADHMITTFQQCFKRKLQYINAEWIHTTFNSTTDISVCSRSEDGWELGSQEALLTGSCPHNINI